MDFDICGKPCQAVDKAFFVCQGVIQRKLLVKKDKLNSLKE